MRQYFFKALGMAACMGLLGTYAQAQDKPGTNEEIIIRKKSDKDAKVTLEIHGDDVIINGKPLADFQDADIIIRKRSADDQLGRTFPPAAPRSPFRGGSTYMDDYSARGYSANSSFLGVMSAKDDKGAKVTGITKASAAEKAGMKEGDIITRVNDSKIETPEDLTKVIAKFKPDEKVTVTYLRNNKEMKAIATLGKRSSAVNLYGSMDMPDFNSNFNFNFNDVDKKYNDAQKRYDDVENRLNILFGRSNMKVGIKAQDTEDGKGVTVLSVDDGSNAQKAGIKEGDILTEFDGQAVNSAPALAEAARNARDKNTVKVKLSRNGKPQELEIKIPKKLKTATL